MLNSKILAAVLDGVLGDHMYAIQFTLHQLSLAWKLRPSSGLELSTVVKMFPSLFIIVFFFCF